MSSELQKSAAWEASTLCTLYKQLLVGAKPLPQSITLAGQTAVITGANGGLGFEAGRQLLQLGLSKLVIGVRSEAKGDAAASKLRDECPNAVVTVSILDLTDYDSISDFCLECEKLERLDYVILNAGLMTSDFRPVEQTTKSNPPPVLSVVGSDTMYLSKLTLSGSIFASIDNPSSYEELPQYVNSKLLLSAFIARLASQVKPEDVIINVCNPGLTRGTGLANHDKDRGLFNRVTTSILVKGMSRPLHVGASIYMYALLASGAASHGSFVSDWDIKPYAPIMYTSDGQKISEQLWKETMSELSFAKDRSIRELFL